MKTCLYHKVAPQGRTFDYQNEEEIEALKKKGWVEAPWLVAQPKKQDDKPNPDESVLKDIEVPNKEVTEKQDPGKE